MSAIPITSKRRFDAFRSAGIREQEASAEPSPPTKARPRSALRALAGWLRPHRGSLLLIVCLGLSSIAIDMLWPLGSRYLVDRVILQSGVPLPLKIRRICLICGVIATLFVANSLFDLWRSFRTQLLSSRFSSALRARLFRRILHLPMPELDELKTGGVIARLSSDVDNTTSLLQMAVLDPVFSGVRLIVTLAIVFSLDWQIAAAIVLAVPPIVFAQNLWVRQSRAIWKSIGEDRAQIDARVSEGLNGLRVVRGFARERREASSYTLGQHTVVRKHSLATSTQRSVALVWDLVMPLTQVVILGFGGYLVLHGQTTVGTLMAFQGYLWRMIDPITELVRSIG
jgi:ABC-type multidrug transport system fused ATPase/permease subunit